MNPIQQTRGELVQARQALATLIEQRENEVKTRLQQWFDRMDQIIQRDWREWVEQTTSAMDSTFGADLEAAKASVAGLKEKLVGAEKSAMLSARVGDLGTPEGTRMIECYTPSGVMHGRTGRVGLTEVIRPESRHRKDLAEEDRAKLGSTVIRLLGRSGLPTANYQSVKSEDGAMVFLPEWLAPVMLPNPVGYGATPTINLLYSARPEGAETLSAPVLQPDDEQEG